MTYDLSQLNEEQTLPVLDTEGAVLVTAGAGSGKTRLLTHRIAHLICDNGVKPWNILAITFTNKAAGEMRDRLFSMLGEEADKIWVSTFHSMCVRILRRYIERVDPAYTSGFSIYGEPEREHLVKRILKDQGADDNLLKGTIKLISDAKNRGFSPEEYRKINEWQSNVGEMTKAYEEYEVAMKKNNALDYDDLLIMALRLLKTDAEAREYYQEKFRYIHVDEFQDTNKVQYDLVRILGAKYGNVFVVGDEDQSIYGWRGANFANIFDFTSDYPCKVYKLERNYRSTKSILALANRIIANNKSRLEKKLWTENADGEEVKCYFARSDGDEADFVVKTIYELKRDKGYRYSDFAILMRINSLSRSFEERMLQYSVPHRVYGGFKFYDRKEVKDLLAYLKILGNHNDEEAILRVINFPRRGIGDGTVTQLMNYSAVTGVSLYDAIYGIENNPDLPAAVVKKVKPFAAVLQCIERAYATGPSLFDLVGYIIKLLGLREYYGENTEENEARKNNIRELAHGIEQFERDNPGAGLDDYLQQISLYSDLDEMSDLNDCVSLATIHSAKGLEFKVVFVVGLEEGIFPDSRRAETASEMEEERRLMYVAVTRAKERLYLTMARSRFRFGTRQDCLPSSFLEEGGFTANEPPRESAYRYYSGRYDSYRGSSGGNSGRDRRYGGRDYAADAVNETSYAPPARPRTVTAVNTDKYRPGVRIRHKTFGEGTVVRVDTSGEPSVEVDFPKFGKLLLLLAYAPIEPIE